ncbi:MAG: EF-hand domain-containing protein [Lentisphaeraceae bacterium]|nr:EF-hand domain-containing protein [Lentisphaeraceae bacterium]
MLKSILILVTISTAFTGCSSNNPSLNASFQKADLDSSGYLSLNEYQKMIRKNTIRHMAHSKLKGAALSKKMIEVESNKFNKTDTNNDNKVTFKEHHAVRLAAAKRKEEKRKAAQNN